MESQGEWVIKSKFEEIRLGFVDEEKIKQV